MIIENIHFNLLEIPTNPPRASSKETSDGRKDSITTLIASIKTNDGLEGIGYAYSLQGAGKAMYWTGRELLEPIMIGENALNHERLFHKVYWRTQTIGRTGLVPQVYSALDMALWDLKGKKSRSSCAQNAWRGQGILQCIHISHGLAMDDRRPDYGSN